MNKFVYTALVATLASSTGFATETDWPELDRELEALSSTLNTQNTGGPQLSGWIITTLDFSGDVMPNGVDDLGGAGFRSIRLNVAGSTADYGYKVSTDLSGGTAVLLDAYGQLNFTENFSMQMGNFKTPFLASQMRAYKRELFLDRTFISGGSVGNLSNLSDPSAIGAGRDAGAMFFGNFADSIGWWLALQNGTDGAANNFRLTGRLAWDAMGEGAGQMVDGAYNSGDGTNMTIAVAYTEDSSETNAAGTPLASMGNDTEQIGGEVYVTSGPFYISGEIVSNGKNLGDNTPFTVTGSYLFNGDWEVALRYQGHDDTVVDIEGDGLGNGTDDLAESTASIGINKYVSGHDVKWTLQYANQSFTTADDIGVISLGLVLAF